MKYLLFVLLVLTLTGCSMFSSGDTSTTSSNSEQQQVNLNPQSDMVSDLTQETIATKYFEVTEADVRQKLLGKTRFALYFHKDDCQTCLDIDKEVSEARDTLSEDMIIAKADFLSEQNLRSDYGITIESSVAIFDQDGNLQEILVSPNLDQILLALNNYEE